MNRRAIHLPMLLVVVTALVAGLWAALARIGWAASAPSPAHVALHGPIMAAGVLGTLIALERAVALAGVSERRWHPAYIAPLLSAVGTVGILVAGATVPAQVLLVAGSGGLLVVSLAMLRTHPTLHVLAMATGAAFLVLANGAWVIGWPIPLAVHWWMAFLVLTIVGERLELARIRVLSPTGTALFAVVASGYVLAELLLAWAPEPGVRLVGGATIALAAWLWRYDIAWLTIRRPGLPSFVAICLLAGYVWLAVAGAIAAATGPVAAGPLYDALVHAVLLGFGFSMVFGHAPIIFPAIIGLPIRFHRALYLPLALLHTSVAARIVGDLANDPAMRTQAGAMNVLAIALYAAMLVAGSVADRLRARRAATR
jgi:hypothetical protein